MEKSLKLWEDGTPPVCAVWHGQFLPTLQAFRDRKIVSLASLSKDGEIAAELIETFGFLAARGSSSKGGRRAIVEVVKLMEENNSPCAITVDGPRGPRLKVQPGVIYIAKKSRRPIIPVTWQASHYKRFNSWDKHMLPYPFSKIDMHIGEPMWLDENLEKENIEKDTKIFEDYFIKFTEEKSPDFI